jgi:hypothetical protein
MPGSVRHPDGRIGPPVPRGRWVVLPERGTMFVREVAGRVAGRVARRGLIVRP